MKRLGLSLIALVIVGAGGIGCKSTANPATQWTGGLSKYVLNPLSGELGQLRKRCADNFECKRAIADIAAASDAGLQWMTANPAPACIERNATTLRRHYEALNEALHAWADGNGLDMRSADDMAAAGQKLFIAAKTCTAD